MSSRWRIFALGWLLVIVGAAGAHFVQTAGGVTIKDLRFTGTDGRTLSGLLYLPSNATPATPAPGILAVHGYINSREVQAPFAIELARRGHVVLALDQGGHGYSEPPAFAHGFGGPAALRYLRGLDVVDGANIGLTGHSMGGWAVLAAAASLPGGYRSMVLHGSSTGAPFAAPGTADWPRNLALVFARYDEFAAFMWEVPRGIDIVHSAKLQALFDSSAEVVEGRLYGDIANGSARVLHIPSATHPGTHLSHAAVGHTLNWFAQTLDGASMEPAGQVWFVKELATLLALAGFVLLLLGSFRVWLGTPYFAELARQPADASFQTRSAGWWLLALAGAVIPVATFYPFFGWGEQLLPPSRWLPQPVTNQIVFWAVMNGLVMMLLGTLVRAGAALPEQRLVPAILIACATFGTAYLAVLLADFLFKVDFRFWFVGVKALSLQQFQMMLVYLPAFTLFFVLAFRALHGSLAVAGDAPRAQFAANAMVMAGGFAVFLLLQYGSLFTRGVLLTPGEPLNTIVMMQFLPLMLIASIIATYSYRHTASHLPGALIAALFVSCYVVAGQATAID